MTRVRTVVSTTTVTCRHLISRKNAHISTRFERHDRAAMGSIIGKITEELPRHEVLTKTASYEIRRYAPCVVAFKHPLLRLESRLRDHARRVAPNLVGRGLRQHLVSRKLLRDFPDDAPHRGAIVTFEARRDVRVLS